LLWDLFQQAQIRDAHTGADTARLRAEIAERKVVELEDKVQALSLACQAMWELMSQAHGLSEHELLSKMTEVDLRDGKLDGKLSTEVVTECPDCGHKAKRVRMNCYWCGTKLASSTPFIK
jgi:hypothetical protein